MAVDKRFPATIALEKETFLNDKKVDAEIYALLQSYSKPIKNSDTKKPQTVVFLKDLPTQKEMCEKIGSKRENVKAMSPKTFRNHLNYLIENNYIDETTIGKDKVYILNEVEDFFFMIPLDTLKFLTNVASQNLIKVYIYLGQVYNKRQKDIVEGKASEKYIFSLEEIGEHIGIKVKNYSKGYEALNDILDALTLFHFIEYVDFNIGTKKMKRLINFSTAKPTSKIGKK